MADPAASIAVDPIYAPSPDMAALLQRLGFAPQTGAAATAAQPPPASAAVAAAPRLVRPPTPVVQAPATPQQPVVQAPPQQPVVPQMARTPTISIPHNVYGLAPASSDPAVVNPMLDQIAQRESGNQNIRNLEGSDASGIYQIRTPTWSEFNQGYTQYKEAIDAPPDVQREVARRIFAARGEAPWLASNPNYKRLHGGAADTSFSPDTAGLIQSLPPEYQALLRQKQANDDAIAKSITEGQNQRSQLIQKMIDERPPVLSGIDTAFAAPPPAPNVQPLQAFQNFGTVLAMLGSLLTRRPMTAALRSGAAAMDAYNKGQYRDYALRRQEWMDNVDLAMKQNQLEIDQYRAKQDQYRDDMDRMHYAMEEIAANNKDTIALQQLRNGQIDDFLQLLQHREDMAQRYAEANMRLRLYGRPLTAGQLLHDQKIVEAQERLKSLYGIDYNDPKQLEKIYNDVQANGGFVDRRTQDILTMYKLANEPTYEGMNSLPGLGGGGSTSGGGGGTGAAPGTVPADVHRRPWPPAYADKPEGAIATDATGRRWKRQGDEAIEIDENGNPM